MADLYGANVQKKKVPAPGEQPGAMTNSAPAPPGPGAATTNTVDTTAPPIGPGTPGGLQATTNTVDTTAPPIGPTTPGGLQPGAPVGTTTPPIGPTTPGGLQPGVAPPTMPDPFGGSGTWDGQNWLPAGYHDGAPGGQPGTPGTPGTPGGTPTTGPAATTNTVGGQFQKKLMELMGQSGDVSETDPSVAGALHQTDIAQQRSFERRRAMSAERAAAQGTLNGGGFDASLDNLEASRGDQTAAQKAGIMGGAAAAKQQQLMQALTLGGQYLSDQQKNEITKQLGELDAQVKREGIQSQTSLGQQDIGLRSRLGDIQGNLGYLGLLSNDRQFGQGLAATNARFTAGLNQDALMKAFGLA